MRSSWVDDETMGHILAAMLPANRLAVEVADATGLRIGDVLALRTEQIAATARPTIRECKTGKRRRVYIPAKLRERMLVQAGPVYIWSGRCDIYKHRTRQTVYKDMLQAAQVYRRSGVVPVGASVSPHSARKRAAVRAYHQGGVDAARALLNHADDDLAVTLLYALSDQQPLRRGAAAPRVQRPAAAAGSPGKGSRARSR